MSRLRRRATLWQAQALTLALFGAVACAPRVGDKCSISTDCSPNGDRLCDTTQPGGYCTVFNCEPDGCPEESVCVVFSERTCPGNPQSVRFQRTFCMELCKANNDCRSGYTCLDTTNDPASQVIDFHPARRTICTVPPAMTPAIDAGLPAVCFAPEASFAVPDAGEGQESSVEASGADDAPAVDETNGD
jgi:hypothetical protein